MNTIWRSAMRAKQAKAYLSTLGFPGNQLAAISHGTEKPVCSKHDEDCWQEESPSSHHADVSPVVGLFIALTAGIRFSMGG